MPARARARLGDAAALGLRRRRGLDGHRGGFGGHDGTGFRHGHGLFRFGATAPADPAPAAAAKPVPAPQAKGGSVAKTRPGARWHSFLPGMFK